MNIILGNFLLGIGAVLGIVLQLFFFLIIAAVIVSWVNADPSNGIVRFLVGTTDPMMKPLQAKLPFLVQKGIDFTPLFALFAIYFLKFFLVGSMSQYAYVIAQSAGVAGAW